MDQTPEPNTGQVWWTRQVQPPPTFRAFHQTCLVPSPDMFGGPDKFSMDRLLEAVTGLVR
jgi:hypothetical protein